MNKSNLKKIIAFVILSLTVVGFIGFVEKQTLFKTYQGAEISIEGLSGVYFVEEAEITRFLNQAFPDLKCGLSLE